MERIVRARVVHNDHFIRSSPLAGEAFKAAFEQAAAVPVDDQDGNGHKARTQHQVINAGAWQRITAAIP
jgi:hypothetical protein